MKYLKEFENHSAYEAYMEGGDVILPNVSYCVSENDVHMTPYDPTPPAPTYDYVEIGGLKWATMNVGATAVTDGGLYFQWGDTQGYTAEQVGSGEGKKYFGLADTPYYTANTGSGSSGFTKYNFTDGKAILEPSDDAARLYMGGTWRLPTTDEFVALGAAVNTAWTNNYESSGMRGLICTDKTDNSKVLFFPAVGFCSNGTIGNVGNNGYYWSSSLSSSKAISAMYMCFGIITTSWQNNTIRPDGVNLRGVMSI